MIKKIFAILFVVLMAQKAYALDCSTAKVCFLMTEGSGATLTDISGNGVTGTLKNDGEPAWDATDVSFHVSGSAPNSLSFADEITNGDYVSLGTTQNTIATHNAAMSFVTWIYPTRDNLGSANQDPRIYTHGDKNTLRIIPTFQLNFTIEGSTQLKRASASNALTANQWQAIAVTWDGTTTATGIKIYVNGVETSYSTTTNGATLTSTDNLALILGDRVDYTRPLAGKLCNTAFYDRVLTPAEVISHYNYGVSNSPSTRGNAGYLRNVKLQNVTIK
jgi:hypothetical protein